MECVQLWNGWLAGTVLSVRVCASRAGMCPLLSALLHLQTGKRVGKVLHASLQSILHKEESLGPKRQKVGFLG